MKGFKAARRVHWPRRRPITSLVAWATMLTAAGAPPAAAQAEARSSALQSALETTRDSLHVKGVSAAVIFPDGTVWTGQAGEAAPGNPVEAATVFDAGSVAKMYTAAVMLQLAGEGTVDLDEPISRWLPDAPNADRITPRMLLTHTSGWADAWSEPSLIPRLVSAPTKRWTSAELLAATPPPAAEPGAMWSYSSSGYVALGMVAEAATDASFGTLVRERVFEPLGLDRTVHGAYQDPTEPLAHAWLDINNDGTAEDFTALLPATSWRTAAGPAGAVLTNAADLAVFTRALVTGELFDERMTKAFGLEWVDRPDGNQHGLGVLRVDLAGTALVGHRGNAAGYSAASWHAPEAGLTIAVLTNKHAIAVTPIVEALIRVAMEPSSYPKDGPARP